MVGKFAIAPCPPNSAAAGEFAHPTMLRAQTGIA